MKKTNIIIFVVISLLLVVALIIRLQYFQNDNNTNLDKEINNVSQKNEIKDAQNEILISEEEKLKKDEISQDDFEQSLIIKNENKLGEFYKSISEDFDYKVSKKTNFNDNNSIKNSIKKTKIQFIIKVTEKDLTKPIDGADIYIRGYYLGKTNENGILDTNYDLPDYFNYYYIQAYKDGYGRGFKKRFDMYYDGGIVEETLKLLDKTIPVKGNTNNFKVVNKNVSIESKDDCILKNNSGECYEGEIVSVINRISGDQLDNFNINMNAIKPDGTMTNLISNGMAFTNFYNKDGEKLIYNTDKLSTICYTIPKKDIEEWNNRQTQANNIEGYRWYDKNTGIWRFDETAILELKGNKWCATTKYIY